MDLRLPAPIDRALRLFHVDFEPAHRQPLTISILVATALSIGGSLLVDALLVTIGQAVFPSTRGQPPRAVAVLGYPTGRLAV
jgi:hypothetical protein